MTATTPSGAVEQDRAIRAAFDAWPRAAEPQSESGGADLEAGA
jgi:hypothetical protein